MIQSFKHKGLERFFLTGCEKGIQACHAKKLNRQLGVLNTAKLPADMNQFGWGWHALHGKRKDRWSVQVNGNWRLTFEFDEGHAELVNYEDYH
ncbi:type II toxin-antitoxin system RelE/ParE family toxin [Paraburkholderia sp. 2C]|jgi:toxin HigB-1